MNSISLYQLKSDYNTALNELLEMEQAGEIDGQTFLDTMAGLEGEVTEKSKNVGAYIRNLESFADQIKAAEQDMAKRRKSIETHAARLRQYLQDSMIDCGITQITSPEFDLKIKKKPASVVIDKDVELPDHYMITKTTKSPDKQTLKSVIQSGKSIDGVRLVSGYRLEIK